MTTQRYALRIYDHRWTRSGDLKERMVSLTHHPTREEALTALAQDIVIHGRRPYRIDDEMAPDLPVPIAARPHGPWARAED